MPAYIIPYRFLINFLEIWEHVFLLAKNEVGYPTDIMRVELEDFGLEFIIFWYIIIFEIY